MPVVELRGNSDLRKALRTFAPDLEKALKKEIGDALKPIVKEARGFVPSESPLSGWATRSFFEGRFPQYDANTIKRGIVYQTTPTKRNKNGFTGMAAVINKSRAGAIYDIAGRSNPSGQQWVGPNGPSGSKYSHSRNPNAGQQFINALPPLTSSLMGRGRLIYKAWANDRGKAYGSVRKAVDEATNKFYARSQQGALRKAS